MDVSFLTKPQQKQKYKEDDGAIPRPSISHYCGCCLRAVANFFDSIAIVLTPALTAAIAVMHGT